MDQIAKGEPVSFNREGGRPRIQITIGGAAGSYLAFRAQGANHTEIGRGRNDEPPTSHPIGNPHHLAEAKVSWQIGVDESPFTQKVVITQDGKTLAQYKYPAGQGPDLTVDFVRMVEA